MRWFIYISFIYNHLPKSRKYLYFFNFIIICNFLNLKSFPKIIIIDFLDQDKIEFYKTVYSIKFTEE